MGVGDWSVTPTNGRRGEAESLVCLSKTPQHAQTNNARRSSASTRNPAITSAITSFWEEWFVPTCASNSTHSTIFKNVTLAAPGTVSELLYVCCCRHKPSHTSREILVIMGSLTSCDPRSISSTLEVGYLSSDWCEIETPSSGFTIFSCWSATEWNAVWSVCLPSCTSAKKSAGKHPVGGQHSTR